MRQTNQVKSFKWKSFSTLLFSLCTIFIASLLTFVIIRGCEMVDRTSDLFSIEVRTQKGIPLRKELYGFNSNMMNGESGYLDEDFVALTKVLRPNTLRFPGGTVGNFYHWKISGFLENEMTTTLSTQLNKRNKGNFVKLRKRREGKIHFDDFMQLCNDLDITPIVVVNLWTGSPEESADWVRYSKEKGYNITHWELGNEYYLPHYANKYPIAKTYMKTAKEHAMAMKAVDPNIKVSVCASPVAFHKEGFLIKTAQRKWDEGLAKPTDSISTDWFDAFSVHIYAYKAMKDVDIEEMRGYLFGWIHYDIDIGMEYYEKLFPDKEMWVTEWNIANPANRVANTQLHAMYVGDFFLKLLSIPQITHANFHVITGQGKGFPVFSPIAPVSDRTFWKYGGEPESDYGNIIRRTVYYSFQLIGEAMSKSDTLFSVTKSNTPFIEGQMDFKGQQLTGVQTQVIGNSKSIYILVSNRSSEVLNPNLYLDGRRLKKNITYQYISNETLKATNGGNAAMEGSGEIEVLIQEWKGKGSDISIPKNSFGVIEVSK
ncbi:MAG: hypothetical protein OXD54_19205 [Candidatus Poribacteria bacterium]|nr:hypothetical protein [Candidatus Poribacteria bacterium]